MFGLQLFSSLGLLTDDWFSENSENNFYQQSIKSVCYSLLCDNSLQFQDYSDDETEKIALMKLKRQGIRVSKTGEVLPPPDWETFKKDYPNVKAAR